MNIKIVFSSCFFLLFLLTIQAQEKDSTRMIGGKMNLDGFRKWRLEWSLDGRQTSVLGVRLKLAGIRGGLEYKRVHRMGIGIYGLQNAVFQKELIGYGSPADSLLFNFSYATVYYERVLWLDPKWECSVTLHAGLGNIRARKLDEVNGNWQQLEPIKVKLLELSTSAYYHFTWWLSGGGGVGFRAMREIPFEVKKEYNGFIYIVKLKIRLGKLVKSCFNEDIKYEY